jgi:hypothetical protein
MLLQVFILNDLREMPQARFSALALSTRFDRYRDEEVRRGLLAVGSSKDRVPGSYRRVGSIPFATRKRPLALKSLGGVLIGRAQSDSYHVDALVGFLRLRGAFGDRIEGLTLGMVPGGE